MPIETPTLVCATAGPAAAAASAKAKSLFIELYSVMWLMDQRATVRSGGHKVAPIAAGGCPRAPDWTPLHRDRETRLHARNTVDPKQDNSYTFRRVKRIRAVGNRALMRRHIDSVQRRMVMSVLGDVFESLKGMSLLQLLLAFVACTAYALAQGALVGRRGRRAAWAMALTAAAGFALESTEWMYAAMLCAFAIVGLGVFVGAVWLLSRSLGLVPRAPATIVDEVQSANDAATQPQRSDLVHSV